MSGAIVQCSVEIVYQPCVYESPRFADRKMQLGTPYNLDRKKTIRSYFVKIAGTVKYASQSAGSLCGQ